MARSTVGLLVVCVVLASAFLGGARAQGLSMAPSMAPGPSSAVMARKAPMAPSMAPRPSSVVMAPTAPMAPTPSTETPLAPGPAAASDCMTVLTDNLYTCLSYVEAGSNMTRPEKGCCQGFAAVVNSRPICLCSLVASKDVYGVQIDRTRSLMLPTVCRVKTPPVSLCAMINGGSPASSPAGSPSAAGVHQFLLCLRRGLLRPPPRLRAAAPTTHASDPLLWRRSSLAYPSRQSPC